MNQKSIHDRIMSRQDGASPEHIDVDDRVKTKHRWLKIAIPSLLGIVVLAGLGYASMKYTTLLDFVLPAVAQTSEAEPELAETPFLEHAKQAGLQTCSTVFPALGEMLTIGSSYNVQSVWNEEAADDHAVHALVGMNYQTESYSGPAAGVVVAAPTESSCEGTMIRVAPFPTSCDKIPSVLPQGSKLTNNLGQIAVAELGSNGGNALLLPTSGGCIVISVASASG